MTGFYLRSSNERAARSLQKGLQISECPNPITDNSTTYYTVQIIVGKGNIYCQLLSRLRIPVRLVISGNIRWIPSDNPTSIGFHAHLYPLRGGRVLEKEINFYLIPNTRIELAVAKRKQFNTYALGGFLPDIPLLEDYNLSFELLNQDNRLLPALSLKNYLLKVGLIGRNGEQP